jgi:hypothetical protein
VHDLPFLERDDGDASAVVRHTRRHDLAEHRYLPEHGCSRTDRRAWGLALQAGSDVAWTDLLLAWLDEH